MGERSTLFDQLLNLVTSNPGTKIISVIIAIVLWIIVLGSRNVEVTKEIPVEVITPADVVAGNDIPEKIAFRLSGPKAFLRAVLDRREDPIRVNLSGAKPGLVTYRFFSDNIRLPIGVKVMSINPSAILVKLEPLKRRDVPVRVELRGFPPDGYRIAKTEVHPKVVRIKGPESKVDSTTEILTLPIDISGARQAIEREAPLDLTRTSVQLEGALPRVKIDVEPASANFRIKNIDIQVRSNHRVKLDQKTVSIMVRVDPKDLASLERNQVTATVDLTGQPKGRYVDQLIKIELPENVGLVKSVPDHVNVTLY
jgi:YbbR domain-containing protein